MVGDLQFVTQRYIWWVGATKSVIYHVETFSNVLGDLSSNKACKLKRQKVDSTIAMKFVNQYMSQIL